jgi:hypothetical protein
MVQDSQADNTESCTEVPDDLANGITAYREALPFHKCSQSRVWNLKTTFLLLCNGMVTNCQSCAMLQ